MKKLSPLTTIDNEVLSVIYSRLTDAIKSFPDGLCRDIYVLSILVEYAPCDTAHSLTLAYNTKSNWKKYCPTGAKSEPGKASSASEARWNYGFWLQDQEIPLYENFQSDEDRNLSRKWLSSHNFNFLDVDPHQDTEKHGIFIDQASGKMWELATYAALQLRDDNFLDRFEQSLPILVHEVHMDGKEQEYVELVNPDGQAKDYLDGWIAINPFTGLIEHG